MYLPAKSDSPPGQQGKVFTPFSLDDYAQALRWSAVNLDEGDPLRNHPALQPDATTEMMIPHAAYLDKVTRPMGAGTLGHDPYNALEGDLEYKGDTYFDTQTDSMYSVRLAFALGTDWAYKEFHTIGTRLQATLNARPGTRLEDRRTERELAGAKAYATTQGMKLNWDLDTATVNDVQLTWETPDPFCMWRSRTAFGREGMPDESPPLSEMVPQFLRVAYGLSFMFRKWRDDAIATRNEDGERIAAEIDSAVAFQPAP
ncbi:MAG: hypothetical protein QF486_03700 [Candidatus Woesearchaeota archaeon]|nr:hypothetical protein [Candidatus Woesearchaeota archaeon]MDP7198701.1 hypothetical protein [Candidatus Woesearchaeota archaeon]MDP7467675.1 hypothetical protein [Candidatus Woesearchaeota archaeon]MDP7647244.1 hypothetical protein [Candidatus Woesearchaeota archaeon]